MKKLGFGLMRLPVTDGTQEHIDQSVVSPILILLMCITTERPKLLSAKPLSNVTTGIPN